MYSIKGRQAVVLCAIPLLLLFTMSARAEVNFGPGAAVFQDGAFLFGGPDVVFPDDYSVPEGGGVLLFHRFRDGVLTIDNGSNLVAGSFLSTFTDSGLAYKADIFVDGGSVQIGSDMGRQGNIVLRGWGDLFVMDGGIVEWIDNNVCDGAPLSCDILIGATSESNTGITVSDIGSLLDASKTNGSLRVGYVPAEVAGGSENFLVALSGGEIRSNGGTVAKGVDSGWSPSIGFVQATAFFDAGTWNIQAVLGSGDDSTLDLGEGDGATANLFIVNGGTVNVVANPTKEGGFYLGQSDVGVPTEGGSNLLGIRGAGSRLMVDNNKGVLSGSRVANGFVTVQENGALELDSSVLIVSGKSGQELEPYNTSTALFNAGFSTLGSANLDVRSGGSVTITDNDAVNLSALIIGQTPANTGPTQLADVAIAGGSISILNTSTKIALNATAYGIPTVSNIGTGTLTISDGSLLLDNGDFVVGAELDDGALVTVDAGGLITADRVVIGWADFDAGGPGIAPAITGDMLLLDGTINGDVYVDDNGEIRGFGTINGTLFGEGGEINVGTSPGTLVVEDLVLGPGTTLVMELALNADGSINLAESDAIVATAGSIDLTEGMVEFVLSSADPSGVELDEIIATGNALVVTDVFDSAEPVNIGNFELEDSEGAPLEQEVTVVNFEKSACKKRGWKSLTRSDGTSFKNQGRCIKYVKTGR